MAKKQSKRARQAAHRAAKADTLAATREPTDDELAALIEPAPGPPRDCHHLRSRTRPDGVQASCSIGLPCCSPTCSGWQHPGPPTGSLW
jgi:hypothetical protein